jgi:hypothetical protein
MTDEIDTKLARVNERLHAGAEQRRSELSAIGFLEPADALKATFGVSKFYLRTPRLTFGDPVFNGCDLTKPGVTGWTEYIPPKVRVRGGERDSNGRVPGAVPEAERDFDGFQGSPRIPTRRTR